jgi:hypothetical protein
MAARVARAESEASGHGTDPRFERAAAALREAREALARGDKAAAARALERAARELGAMENRSGSASERALSRLMSRAADLDRSLRAGMRGEKDGAGKGDKSGGKSGKSGKSGKGDQAEKGGKGDKGDKGAGSGAGDGDDDDDGEGDGDGDGKAKGGAKSGSGKQGAGQKQGGQPGVGPDGPGASMDHGGGPEAQRIRVTGNLTVRGDAREGERAVSAIQGMGQGGDGRAFREVFPSYDSAVEDGLRDELVPAARRPVVRRYFSSIRPGDAPAGTE